MSEYFVKTTKGYLEETLYDFKLVESINNACWFGSYESAVKVAVYYSKKHNLILNYDIEIIEEEHIVKQTRLPIGDFDEWVICDVCKIWTKAYDLFNARYNHEKYICPQCRRDGN